MGTNPDTGLVAGVFILCGGKASPLRCRGPCPLVLGEYLAELEGVRTFLSQSLLWFLVAEAEM